MSDIGGMVAELIEAGCAPEVAAQVVARVFVAGVASGGSRVDKTTENRRAWDREYRRKKREQEVLSGGCRVESADVANVPLSSLKEDNRKRGARLDVGWTPNEDERAFARDLSWSESQIDSEAANFRDYWTAKPGTGGVKLDWTATWRKWIRSSKVKPAGDARAAGMARPEETNWRPLVESFKKFGTWPRGHGNEPGSPACRAPADLLREFGYG